MSSLNKVQLIGRIGKDPIPHIFSDGSSVVGFSLATSEKWKDKTTQEWKEITEWHNIHVKNPIHVDYVNNQLSKGDLIYIEGELRHRKWTDKNGAERTITEVVIGAYKSEIKLLKKNDETAKTYVEPLAYDKRKADHKQAQQDAKLEDDDVPF